MPLKNPWMQNAPKSSTTVQHPKWGVDTTSPTVQNPNGDPGEMMANPYYGLPDPASYTPGYDPESMSLAPGLESKLNAIQMNKSGLNEFRQEALRKGPSTWATLAKADQGALANNARDRGAQAASGQTAQAMDRLAASGGLSAGAKERAQMSGGKNALAMDQDTARQENLNDLQIGMNDEQNRIQQLGQLPGMEYQAIQPDMAKASAWEGARASDVSAQSQEAQRKQQYDQWLAEQQQKLYSGNQQANATAKGK